MFFANLAILLKRFFFLSGLPAFLLIFSGPAQAAGERFLPTGDTVADTVAGLIWVADGDLAGRELSFSEARAFVAALNSEKFAGYSDWRMPGIEELQKLVEGARAGLSDREKDMPVFTLLEKAEFRNIGKGDFWSGTESFFYNLEGLAMNMTSGKKNRFSKKLHFKVLAVRTEQ